MGKTEDYILYAVVEGKKFYIEDLIYTATREKEPVFEMGTPIFRQLGRRTLSGNLTIGSEVMQKLRDAYFDIHIKDIKNNRSIVLQKIWITSYSHTDVGGYFATFIADNLDVNELKELEEMTNRELAKRLLTKEY